MLTEMDVVHMWNNFEGSNQSCVEYYAFIVPAVFSNKSSRWFSARQLAKVATQTRVKRLRCEEALSIFQELNAWVMFESYLENKYGYTLNEHGLFGDEHFEDRCRALLKLCKPKRDQSPRRPTPRTALGDVLGLVIRQIRMSVDSLIALHSTAKSLRPHFHSFEIYAQDHPRVNFIIPDYNTWQFCCYTLGHRGLNWYSRTGDKKQSQLALDRYAARHVRAYNYPPTVTSYPWDPLAHRPLCEYFFALRTYIVDQSLIAFNYFCTVIGRPHSFRYVDGEIDLQSGSTIREQMFTNRDLNSPQVVAAYAAALKWEHQPAIQLTRWLMTDYNWETDAFNMGTATLPITIE